jgi:hypothetical protein
MGTEAGGDRDGRAPTGRSTPGSGRLTDTLSFRLLLSARYRPMQRPCSSASYEGLPPPAASPARLRLRLAPRRPLAKALLPPPTPSLFSLSWFESSNHYYLTFPLLTGGELLQRILDKRRFTEEEARRAMVNVLETLAYIHHNVRSRPSGRLGLSFQTAGAMKEVEGLFADVRWQIRSIARRALSIEVRCFPLGSSTRPSTTGGLPLQRRARARRFSERKAGGCTPTTHLTGASPSTRSLRIEPSFGPPCPPLLCPHWLSALPDPVLTEFPTVTGFARACADIKAENFLYKTRESAIDDFQLIDFGISKVRGMSGLHTRSFTERLDRPRVAAP